MAINVDKFLPPPKSAATGGALVAQKPLSGNLKLSTKKINLSKLLPGSEDNDQENILAAIVKQVFQIRDLVLKSSVFKKKQISKDRIQDENENFAKKEKKLEEKPSKEEKSLKVPSLPKLGFLDYLKNFIFKTLIGYFVYNLIPHLPKLINFVKNLTPIFDFLVDISGKLFNGLVSFIDGSYKAIDATRGFIKSVGGEFSLQIFDNFTGAVEGVITATIAAALALSAMSGGDSGGSPGGGKGGSPSKSGKPLWKEYDQKRALIRKNHGDAAAKIYDNEISNGKTPKQAFQNLKNRYISKGKIVSQRQLGLGEIKGSKLFGKGVDKVPGRLATKILGRSGKKAILGFVRPLLKRLPIIGALIDFGLSVALGEDPGRAAFKAIGAALLGTIGAAIGALAFGFGGIIGGILGSLGGEAIGGALYDMFFGGKKPQQKNQKVEKKAGGGITRGNKPAGGKIGRTVKKPKRTVRTSRSKVNPGKSIGGEKKLKNIFPEVKDKSKKINPFGYMKSSYEKLSSAEAFGGLFALPLKAQLGEQPSKTDYQNAASGLNSWMQRTFSSETMRTGGVGFAGGGKVEASMFGNSEDMTKVIEKSLEDSISSKVTAAINDLKKQLGLKPDEGESKDKKSDDPGMSGTGDYSPEGLQGEIYKYLISKGMDDIHAIGLMANISRESEFRPGIDEIGGGGGVGLFQYTSEPRKGNFLKAVPDYKTNWKGQIDYALKEPGEPAPQWLAMKFSSSQEAADWFMRKWERPREDIQSTLGPKKHKEYIASLEKYKSKTGKGYNLPSGSLSMGDGKFIQGNSGRSGGVHFHIGTNTHGDAEGSTKAAFSTIKHFLGKKSVNVGRSGEFIPAGAKDDQIKGYIARGMSAHATRGRGPTEIDLQIGGMDGRQNNVAFPLALKNMTYSSTSGYGVKSDISGVNAFVGHGRYKPDGSLAKQDGTPNQGPLSSGAPDFYAFHGKIGFASRDNMILKLHKGEMFKVVDKDSVDLFGTSLVQDIINIENKSQLISRAPYIIEKLKKLSGYISPNDSQISQSVTSKPDMSVLQSYAPYERQNQEIVVQLPPPEIVEVFVPVPMGGSASYGGGSGSDSYDSLAER